MSCVLKGVRVPPHPALSPGRGDRRRGFSGRSGFPTPRQSRVEDRRIEWKKLAFLPPLLRAVEERAGERRRPSLSPLVPRRARESSRSLRRGLLLRRVGERRHLQTANKSPSPLALSPLRREREKTIESVGQVA